MAKFTLNVQLQLQSPKNVAQVVNQLQKQLGAVNVNVGVQGASQATKQLAQVNAAANRATNSAQKMGDAFGVSLKRFTAFSIASRAIGLFSSKLSGAVEEAISFQNEIVRLSQVTGESVKSFGKLTAQITNLSTTLGVSSKELLSVATILAQAGLNAKDTEVAVNALAKTALAPTFGDIADTAEGAVAVIAQFGEGVGALERQLGSINEVSAKFAVESEDLISVIRRTGGVFKASGGSLEELLALFTSVRATTREGAETIATGLRTIFTRLQRPQTIEYLKQFGVQLTDLNGKFIGPYESIRQLSQALSGLEEGDVRFIQIAEELGGYRQIGKVIPLLRQFEIAEKARQAAIEGGTSLDKDAITAQQSLAVQFTKVREQFLALIRGISETSSFQVLVKTSLNLASALIKIADALKPLIPILATFAAIKFTQNIGGFLQGVGAGFGKIVGPNPGKGRQFGGPIRGFATGGLVPGTGNGDTVPAMLSPGEFVIRKSSVKKLGAGTLAAMNNNRYASGGVIKVKNPEQYGAFVLDSASGASLASTPVGLSPTANVYADQLVQQREKGSGEAGKYKIQGPFPVFGIGSPASIQQDFKEEFSKASKSAIVAGASAILSSDVAKKLNIGPFKAEDNFAFNVQDVLEGAQNTIEGYLLEAVVGSVGGLKVGLSKSEKKGIYADFDFPILTAETADRLKNLFDPNDKISSLKRADAKRQRVTAADKDKGLHNKVIKDLRNQSQFDFIPDFVSSSGISDDDLLNYGKSLTKAKLKELNVISKSSGLNLQNINKLPKGINRQALEDAYNQSLVGKAFGGIIQKFAKGTTGKGVKSAVKKGEQIGSVGIFDSDMIAGGTNVKKAILDQIKLSKKPYEVVAGPAGSGKTTFATARFGKNFILSLEDIAKYARFVVLSGAAKTKTGDFSEEVQSLMSGASKISLLSPDVERLMQQRQGRVDAATTGGLLDTRSVGALQGTMKAPTEANEELFQRYKNVEILRQYALGGLAKFARGTSGKGVKKGFYRTPLIDDIKNTPDAIQPNPGIAIKSILASGYGALDVDRTLFRTIGDLAYEKAPTPKAKNEVLDKYFRNAKARLNDVKTAKITQFGQQLKKAIADGSINPNNLSVISKSGRTPGLAEYINQVFGIPTTNMIFTSGGDKGRPLDAQRIKGPRNTRVMRKATGGSIASSDTVPALLTPGEFVFNKNAAQSIGYSTLNRMNKKGVTGFAKGGAVGIQRFAEGGDAKTAKLFGLGAIATLPAMISQFAGPVDESSSALYKLVDSLGQVITTIASVTIGLEAFGISLNKDTIKSFFSGGPGSFSGTVKKIFSDIGASAKIPSQQLKVNKTQRDQIDAGLKFRQKKIDIQTNATKLAQLQSQPKSQRSQQQEDFLSKAIQADKIKMEEFRTKAKDARAKNILASDQLDSLLPSRKTFGGKIGSFLGKGGKLGGIAGRGIGAIGPLVSGLTRLAGPVGAVITAVGIFSKIINDVNGYQNKYNKAIQEGNVAKAQELAVLKEVPGIVQLFGSSVAEGYQSFITAFGGNSVESIKALAVAQATAGKYTKEFEQNAKKAANVMSDLESGAISASQALANKDLTANLRNASDALNAAKTSAQANLGNKSTGFLAGTRDVFSTLSLGYVETSSQRNTKIDQENKQLTDAAKKTFTENVDQLRPAFRGLASEFAISGKSTAEAGAAFDKTLNDMGLTSLLTTAELDNLKKEFKNQAKAVEENIKFLKALNFGLRDVNANAQATTLSLSNLEGSLETGYNGFSQALSILEASIESTGAALDATDVSKATKTLEDTLKGFGASDAEVKNATGGLKALQVAQSGAETALKNISKGIDPKDLSPEKIKEQLGTELGKILDSQSVDPASKKRLIESFSNLKIDDAIQQELAAGNYGQVVEKIFGPLGDQVKKDVLGPLQERIKQEGVLVNLTKERINLERNAIEARKQAIDIEIEARKAVEEFGGPVVKTKDKINALNRQLDLDLGAAGVGGVGAGTAFELGATQSRIMSAMARREALQATSVASTGRGAFEGARGTEQDKAAQLEQAQQAIIDYSRRRIDLIKEELQVAEKKNALEKSAFQKLVGGDIIGAIQDQQAAAAAKILKSGDKQFAKLFGPTALGAGLQSLEEQGASAQELKNAALAAGGSLRQAQVFSRTTPEMEALKQQGRQFAGILETAGKAQADIKDMQVQTQNVVINTARIQMGASANVQPFSRGGTVYASRGMFIPRGTDTVPAMLTPGEFVINRRAVQAGNNLQILKAINNGGKINNSSGGTAAGMAKGGQVGYYMFGGMVESLGNTLGNLGGVLSPIFDKFNESVKQLQNMQLSVKLDTTNVNINFNGAGFLATLTEDVKNGVLEKVRQEITNKMTIGTDGKARFSGSTL